ncbi:ribulose-phosphate 3-epimerase [Paraconexibacter sp.]|uniref:ribulose-phosphate 3-epimerase n=1 Tax=Paraconexibacter sp. TaxID=2949640 RepID=UPI00356A05F7
MSSIQIAPSILSADFARLEQQVATVIEAGVTWIHVDVMDGVFVPPITMGPIVVQALRAAFGDRIVLDCHLMIDRPERQVDAFAQAGADVITFHAEATAHSHRVVQAIREHGVKAGIAVCPGTPLQVFEEVDVDLALCMTVNPGWGGQPFIPTSPAKIERLRSIIGPDVALEVDGGVDATTAPKVVRAGATHLVAGSAVFGKDDPAGAVREIADAARL